MTDDMIHLKPGMQFKAVGLAKAKPGHGAADRNLILPGTGGKLHVRTKEYKPGGWSREVEKVEDTSVAPELVKALSEAVWVVAAAEFSGGDRNFRDPWPDSWHVTAKTECGGEEYTICFVQAGTFGSNCYNSAMEVEVLT